MAAPRVEYILDTDGLGAADRVAAWDAAMSAVRQTVDAAEVDIPWSNRELWPQDVHDAAARLVALYVASEARGAYMQTGVREVDASTLADFVTFAPYAFDATLWDEADRVAVLSDEGQSFVVALTEAQHHALVARVGGERVVPVVEWRRRRKR